MVSTRRACTHRYFTRNSHVGVTLFPEGVIISIIIIPTPSRRSGQPRAHASLQPTMVRTLHQRTKERRQTSRPTRRETGPNHPTVEISHHATDESAISTALVAIHRSTGHLLHPTVPEKGPKVCVCFCRHGTLVSGIGPLASHPAERRRTRSVTLPERSTRKDDSGPRASHQTHLVPGVAGGKP